MKKLLIVTAAAMLTSGAMGCRCCEWLSRGSYSAPAAYPAAPACASPCAPAYNPCDPCAGGATAPIAQPVAPPVTVVPGPAQ